MNSQKCVFPDADFSKKIFGVQAWMSLITEQFERFILADGKRDKIMYAKVLLMFTCDLNLMKD